jgi:hypothetical protein
MNKINISKVSAGDVIHTDKKGTLGLVLKTMLSEKNISSFDIIPIVKHTSSYTGQNSDRSTMMPNDVKAELGLSLDNQYEIQIQPSVISSETLIGDDGKITCQGTLAESSLFSGTLEKLYAHLDKELETGGDTRRAITRISKRTASHRLEIVRSQDGGIYDIDLTDASEKHDLIQIETARILKLAGIHRLLTARDIARDKENPHHLKQIYDLADNPAIDFETFKSDIIQGAQRFLEEAPSHPDIYINKDIDFKFPKKEVVNFEFKPVAQQDTAQDTNNNAPQLSAPISAILNDAPVAVVSAPPARTDTTIQTARKNFQFGETVSILKAGGIKTMTAAYSLASEKKPVELRNIYNEAVFPIISFETLRADIIDAYSKTYPDREIK